MRENNSHAEAAFQSRVGNSVFYVCLALFPLLGPDFAGAGVRAHGTEAKLLTIFSSPGSRWKAGGRGEQPGSQSWSESMVVRLTLTCRSTESPACVKLL